MYLFFLVHILLTLHLVIIYGFFGDYNHIIYKFNNLLKLKTKQNEIKRKKRKLSRCVYDSIPKIVDLLNKKKL